MTRIVYAGFRDPVEMGGGSENYWSESKHGERIACTSDDNLWFRFTGVAPGAMTTFDVVVPVTNITALRFAKEAPAPRPIADEPPNGPMKKQHQETKK